MNYKNITDFQIYNIKISILLLQNKLKEANLLSPIIEKQNVSSLKILDNLQPSVETPTNICNCSQCGEEINEPICPKCYFQNEDIS